MGNIFKIAILLSFFYIHPAFSQQHEIDSLSKLLDKHSRQDSNRVNYMTALAFRYSYKDPDKGLSLANEALLLAKKLKYEKGVARAYRMHGANYFKKSNYEKAVQYHKKSLDLCLKIKDSLCIADAYGNIGAIYNTRGLYDLAITYFKKTIPIYQKNKNLMNVEIAYFNIGNAYDHKNNLKDALKYTLKSLEIAEEIDDSIGLRYSYNYLGGLLNQQGKKEKALEYYQKALEIAQKSGDLEGVANTCGHLGDFYRDEKKYKQAEEYYSKALTFFEKTGDMRFSAITLSDISFLYEKMGNFEKAIGYEQKALNIRQELKIDREISESLNALGALFTKTKNFNLAEKYLKEGLETAQKAKNMSVMYNSYKDMSTLDSLRGNYRQALIYYHQYTSLKNKSDEENKAEELSRLETQYQINKRESQIEKQKISLEKQQLLINKRNLTNTALLIGIGILLILVIAFFWFSQKLKQKNTKLSLQNNQIIQQKEEINTQKEEIIAQSEFLKTTNHKLVQLDRMKEDLTQMLIHDLKTPLSTVLLQSDNKEIQKAGKQMFQMVSNILDVQRFEEAKMDIQKTEWYLSEVINEVREQTAVLLEEKKLSLMIHPGKDAMVLADRDLVSRVLTNLLSNAIKHSPFGGAVKIFTESVDSQQIQVFVEDNGKGISPEYMGHIFDKYHTKNTTSDFYNSSTGLGLTFCKMVIEAHHHEIGVNSEINKGALFWFTLDTLEQSDMKNGGLIWSDTTGFSAVVMTNEEKVVLIPFIDQLKELSIFQATRIKHIIKEIDDNQYPNLKTWKEEMKECIYACDQAAFNKLLSVKL